MSENTKARGAHRLQPRVAASKVALVLLIATLSLSGCVFKRFLGSKAEPTAIPAGEPTSVADEESSEVDAAPEVLPRLIERAKEDLVQTTGAGAEEITVVSTEEVEWGDTSLGCPEPDGMYAQMITPGYLIVLESGDRTYDYHSGSDPEGPLVQCTAEGTPAGESQLDENAAPDSGAQDDEVAPDSGAQDDEVAPDSGAQDDDAAPEVLPRLIERAKEDLVQTTGAGAEEITVVSTEEVEWGDTSLGCPEPDGMYAQMITPGYLIVLESGDLAYNYHSGSDPEGPLVQCTADGTPAGESQLDENAVPNSGAQDDEVAPSSGAQDDDAAPEVLPRLIERAKEDLVQTTGAGADEITVVSTEEVEWGDTSLGCPEPDGMYAQVITPGYLIVLESGGDVYDYHSGLDPEGPLVQCNLQDDSEE